MDRLHVTRSHGSPARGASSCLASQRPAANAEDPDPPIPSVQSSDRLPSLFQDRIQLPE